MSEKNTLEDIRDARREFRVPGASQNMWIYQFGLKLGEEQEKFDFRLSEFPSRREADLVVDMEISKDLTEDLDEDESVWVLNQVRGFPRMPALVVESARAGEEELVEFANLDRDDTMDKSEYNQKMREIIASLDERDQDGQ